MASMSYDELMKTSQDDYITPFWQKAFKSQLVLVWGETKFESAIETLSYHRCISSMLRNSRLGMENRMELLFAYLNYAFSAKKPSDPLFKFRKTLPNDNSYFTRVIKNLCVVYNEPVAREFDKFKNYELINTLLNEISIDNTLLNIHRYTKSQGECLVRPILRNGKLKIEIIPPDKYNVEIVSDGTIEQVWLPYVVVKETKTKYEYINNFYVWDAKTLRVADSKGDFIPFEYEGGKYTEYQHLIGQLPFIQYRLNNQYDEEGSIIGGDLGSLVIGQLDCNAIDFNIKQSVYYNSFPFLAMINCKEKNKEIELGFGKAVQFDNVDIDMQAPSLEFISPNPQYADLQLLKETIMKQYLRQMGLPTTLISDNPGYPSGVAMQTDRKELEEIRKEDVSQLKIIEKELIILILKYSNLYVNDYKNKFPKPEDIEIKIDYKEQDIYTEPADKLTYFNSLKDAGLISPLAYVTKIAQIDFIADDAEAIEYIKQNKYLFTTINEAQNAGTNNPTDKPVGTSQAEKFANPKLVNNNQIATITETTNGAGSPNNQT